MMTWLWSRPRLAVTLWLSLVYLTGCNNKYTDLYSVTGTVKFQGQPVPMGTVTFYPQDGSRPATGNLSEDGSYQLKTYADGPGAISGQHKVTIEAYRETANVIPLGEVTFEPTFEQKLALTKTEWLVPIEYSQRDASTLTAEVKQEENQINFDLPVE